MRAYWSAASAMTGRTSLSKNLWPPGHLPPSGLVDQNLAVAPGTIATLGFSGLPRDVAT